MGDHELQHAACIIRCCRHQRKQIHKEQLMVRPMFEQDKHSETTDTTKRDAYQVEVTKWRKLRTKYEKTYEAQAAAWHDADTEAAANVDAAEDTLKDAEAKVEEIEDTLGSGQWTGLDLVTARADVEVASAVLGRKVALAKASGGSKPFNGSTAYDVAAAFSVIAPEGVGVVVVDPGESVPRTVRKGDHGTLYVKAAIIPRRNDHLGADLREPEVSADVHLVAALPGADIFTVLGDASRGNDGRGDLRTNNALREMDAPFRVDTSQMHHTWFKVRRHEGEREMKQVGTERIRTVDYNGNPTSNFADVPVMVPVHR
jgi:hypothetical protein